MNFVIAATVFPVILIGELPDKTMFASLIMGARGRPLAVWLGAAVAFLVHVVIAVSVGMAAVLLLPRRALEATVAALFLAGAIVVIRGMRRGRQEEASASTPTGPPASVSRAALTSFVVIFVAEWGDLTQVLIANLAAHYHSPVSAGLGSLLALWLVAGIAVAGGRWLGRVLNVTILRAGTAAVLAAFAAYTGWLALP